MSQSKKSPPPLRPNQCTFFIAAKNRHCPLLIGKASLVPFCPNHTPKTTPDPSRTPCPFCASPIVSKDLAKHCKRCPKKPIDVHPPFYKLDVNIPPVSTTTTPPTPPHVRDLSPTALQSLFTKIRSAHANHVTPPTPTTLPKTPTTSKSTTQVTSLVSLLSTLHVLSPTNTFIEMGCGTAEFSHGVNESIMERCEPTLEKGTTRFILVDREPSRWKVKMDRGEFVKVRIDIKDLVLREVLGDGKEVDGVVCISKHLCGAATDLTLRCLQNYKDSNPRVAVKAIVIALCCHHRCTLATYVNPGFIERLGFSPVEFSYLCYMSSWGAVAESITSTTAESKPKRQKVDPESLQEDDEEAHECGVDSTLDDGKEGKHFSGLDVCERRVLGRMIKGLLNAGRVEFAREMLGFGRVETREYSSVHVTPENVVLVCEQ
ncbi:tRNA:m4X modification enzyme [Podochytrium sp. JEL0797]|nr:tRNA:m4X modification enzyme [Podochytrium sp. JEL0797]